MKSTVQIIQFIYDKEEEKNHLWNLNFYLRAFGNVMKKMDNVSPFLDCPFDKLHIKFLRIPLIVENSILTEWKYLK